MNQLQPTARLRVVAGDGLIVRRDSALLFVPTGERALVDVFEDAAAGSELEAVTVAAEDSSSETGEFAVMTWYSGLRVALFGAIDIVSDHRSLPHLTAAGSGTWIERTVARIETVLTIGVSLDHADPRTDLRVGVVGAGGFELVLTSTTGLEAPPEVRSPGGPPEVVPAADEWDQSPAPPPTLQTPADLASVIWGAAPASSPEQDAAGAQNIPMLDRFEEPSPRSKGSQPTSGWTLQFSDGRIEEVDAVLVLGRSPAVHDDQGRRRAVSLDCARTSGSHLEISEVDGSLFLTDLESRNGSFMLTSGDAQPVRLEAQRPERVPSGTHVQIGSILFVVEHSESD